MRIMKRLGKILSLLTLILMGCVSTGNKHIPDRRLSQDSQIKICVVNNSLDAHQLYFDRTLSLGSIYPGQSRWVFIPIDGGLDLILRTHNITGGADFFARSYTQSPTNFWIWEITDSKINNTMSLIPLRGRSKCD